MRMDNIYKRRSCWGIYSPTSTSFILFYVSPFIIDNLDSTYSLTVVWF